MTPCPDHAEELQGPVDLSPLQPCLPMTDLPDGSLSDPTATSFSSGTDRDDSYYGYIKSVTSFVSGLFQISETVFIVQGWDRNRETAMVEY